MIKINYKRISVGLITKIVINRDLNNNTFKSDKDFINNKKLIINILNKDLNLKLFNIFYTDKSIILTLKTNSIKKYILDLDSFFSKHILYIFNKSNSYCSDINFGNIVNTSHLSEIDLDNKSNFYPISLTIEAYELWISKPLLIIFNQDMLDQLKYFNHVFNNNPLIKNLIYGIDNCK